MLQRNKDIHYDDKSKVSEACGGAHWSTCACGAIIAFLRSLGSLASFWKDPPAGCWPVDRRGIIPLLQPRASSIWKVEKLQQRWTGHRRSVVELSWELGDYCCLVHDPIASTIIASLLLVLQMQSIHPFASSYSLISLYLNIWSTTTTVTTWGPPVYLLKPRSTHTAVHLQHTLSYLLKKECTLLVPEYSRPLACIYP
jgi:hypothetical protein